MWRQSVSGRKKRKPSNKGTDAAVKRAREMLTAPSERYIPTTREREILTKQKEREEAQPPAPRLRVVEWGAGLRVMPDHPDERVGLALLREAMGAETDEFVAGVLAQLGHACMRDDKIDEGNVNHLFSVVRGIHPRDQIETMLAMQMASIHVLMNQSTELLARCETKEHQAIVERAINSLTRTFAAQMDALKRYRSGGEQKVTVQHVSVNEGGRAIVGNVTQDVPGSASQKSAANPLALTDSRQQPMPIIEERCERELVPARRKQRDNGKSSS